LISLEWTLHYYLTAFTIMSKKRIIEAEQPAPISVEEIRIPLSPVAPANSPMPAVSPPEVEPQAAVGKAPRRNPKRQPKKSSAAEDEAHAAKAKPVAGSDEKKPRVYHVVLIRELKEMARDKGCQTTPAARSLIKGTFSKEKQLAFAVMEASIENKPSLPCRPP
jgi:hypothetical protein